jgi:ribonuclease HI
MKHIYCDATLRTVAIKDNDFELSIPVDTSDILHNELLAILVAVKYAHQQEDKVIKIHTDSLAAFRTLNEGYSSHRIKSSCTRYLIDELRYTFYEAPTKAFCIDVCVVAGKENLADKISRKLISLDWHKHLFLYQ